MFVGLAGFRLEASVLLLDDDFLVLFELAFESQIGEDGGPAFAYILNGLLEGPVELFHEVGDDESRGLKIGQELLWRCRRHNVPKYSLT